MLGISRFKAKPEEPPKPDTPEPDTPEPEEEEEPNLTPRPSGQGGEVTGADLEPLLRRLDALEAAGKGRAAHAAKLEAGMTALKAEAEALTSGEAVREARLAGAAALVAALDESKASKEELGAVQAKLAELTAKRAEEERLGLTMTDVKVAHHLALLRAVCSALRAFFLPF